MATAITNITITRKSIAPMTLMVTIPSKDRPATEIHISKCYRADKLLICGQTIQNNIFYRHMEGHMLQREQCWLCKLHGNWEFPTQNTITETKPYQLSLNTYF
jgi:hypothetical protein